MAITVVFDDGVEIPLDLRSLADFRRWAASDDFPERGRIDYLADRIEVQLSPEDLFGHGTLKTEIAAVLARRVKQRRLGHVVASRTRVSCPAADLSVQPDTVFISHETLHTGRARLVPKAGSEPGRYIEVEGAPDLVVEIVSDASVRKDTRRLPEAYFQAGVPEFWLADARGQDLLFQIHVRGESGYRAAERDSEGFQKSAVFGCGFRLDGRRDAQGNWAFDLREKQ